MTIKTADLTFRFIMTQTVLTFPNQNCSHQVSHINTTFMATNGSYESCFLVVREASTVPKSNSAQTVPRGLQLQPLMQPTFSMPHQTMINAASITSQPSWNNAILPDNREIRSNPHQSAKFFLQPSLIQNISSQTTWPEFIGQASVLPQPTTYFDICRDNRERDKIDFKNTVKLPPIQIPSFDSDPLVFHDWLSMFNATVDSITNNNCTHRITHQKMLWLVRRKS